MKSELPTMWQSNPMSWCTRHVFVEWVYETFGPLVKEYLDEKQLPLRCFLVMDNATVHSQDLDDDLPGEFDSNNVKILATSTTPLLQPISHQVISNFIWFYARSIFRKCLDVANDAQLTLGEYWKDHFTILNCLTLIDDALNQITCRTLNSAWKKLWPDSVAV